MHIYHLQSWNIGLWRGPGLSLKQTCLVGREKKIKDDDHDDDDDDMDTVMGPNELYTFSVAGWCLYAVSKQITWTEEMLNLLTDITWVSPIWHWQQPSIPFQTHDNQN